MKIREIMHGITVVDQNISVLDAAKLMVAKNIGSVLAKEDGCVKIATERDILRKVVAFGKNPKLIRVSDIMSDCVHTIDAGMDVFDASDMFNKYHIRRLPVRENGEIVGIITARDLAKSISYLAARKLTHQEDYGRRSYDWPNPSL
jgi:CBS domain-containing protein